VPEDSLTSEGRALAEFWDLQSDPVYHGRGVPHGSGDLVLVLPGLFGNDIYLRPLRNWLGRIGYHPAISSIPLNAGCPDRLQRRVLQSLTRRLARYHGPIAIIGHSRGGILGKAIASRLGERCTRLIALGSPVGAAMRASREELATLTRPGGGELAARPVAQAGRLAMRLFSPDCRFPACDCGYVRDLLAPLPATTRVSAIYSTEDPVVAPAACQIDGAHNIAVTGTHSGLVVNKTAYPHIARALAEAGADDPDPADAEASG
jgi:triacylglycerol lipase